jgi:hypothetical protein
VGNDSCGGRLALASAVSSQADLRLDVHGDDARRAEVVTRIRIRSALVPVAYQLHVSIACFGGGHPAHSGHDLVWKRSAGRLRVDRGRQLRFRVTGALSPAWTRRATAANDDPRTRRHSCTKRLELSKCALVTSAQRVGSGGRRPDIVDPARSLEREAPQPADGCLLELD